MFGQRRQKIEALDLSAVAEAAVRRHAWSAERAKCAENEYRKFLYLLMLGPTETLSPWSDDLDLFWHEHILHTSKYAADCQYLFGRFINHDPSISKRPIAEANAKRLTAWAYRNIFGRHPAKDGASWLLPTTASLAAVDAMIPATKPTLFSKARDSAGGGGGCGGGGCGGGGCGGG